MSEIVIRFIAGGVVVSAFALIGDLSWADAIRQTKNRT
jgi:hypothetical protein